MPTITVNYNTPFDFGYSSYTLREMKVSAALFLPLLLVFTAWHSHARLEYDSSTNNAEIYGPYLKYNLLNKPFSIGRYHFTLDDFRLGIAGVAQKNSEQLGTKIYATWPRFFMNFGQLQIVSLNGRVLYKSDFSTEQTGEDEKLSRFHLEDENENLLEALNEGFQICIEQEFEQSKTIACSDRWIYKNGQFIKLDPDKAKVKAILNGKPVPKNAQISLSKKIPTFQLKLLFQSGFKIEIKDQTHLLDIKNVIIDPIKRRIGVVDGQGKVRPSRLTTKDRFFSFIKENNYFKQKFNQDQGWTENLEHQEMEFAPYLTGMGVQLYGLLLPKLPPPFQFELDENAPIATYSSFVEVRGTKKKEDVLTAKKRHELFLHDDGTSFIWRFPAPEKGTINLNYLGLKKNGTNYYFSHRVFRSQPTQISGSIGLSVSPTLEVVPGYNFSAEHWFEKIWGAESLSFQRWGVAANIYETIQAFKPAESFPEKISINPINLDLMMRFHKGVRPVQSSFGLGVRYLSFKLFRSVSSDIQTSMLGVGAFWHTAPQKIVDDVFNIIPFFRYPKWMELSFYMYPAALDDVELGLSFSWQAKGKLYIFKSLFLEASFNVNSVSFKKENSSGRLESFGIATAHGTVGLGYQF